MDFAHEKFCCVMLATYVEFLSTTYVRRVLDQIPRLHQNARRHVSPRCVSQKNRFPKTCFAKPVSSPHPLAHVYSNGRPDGSSEIAYPRRVPGTCFPKRVTRNALPGTPFPKTPFPRFHTSSARFRSLGSVFDCRFARFGFDFRLSI